MTSDLDLESQPKKWQDTFLKSKKIKETLWYITIMIVLKFIEQYKQLENLTIFLKYVQHSKVIPCLVINLRCYGNSFGGSLQLTYISNPTRIPTILKVLKSTSLMPIVARAQLFCVFCVLLGQILGK